MSRKRKPGTPGFEPFLDPDGNLRCGRKARTPKPADHPLVVYQVEQLGVELETARWRCLAWPVEGRDCCKNHGGKTPIVHGLYSQYPVSSLREKIEKARANPRLRELEEQLAIVAASLNHSLEKIDQAKACHVCGQAPERSLVVAERISRIADRFATIAERKQRMEEGFKLKLIKDNRAELITLFAELMRDAGLEPETVGEIIRGARRRASTE